MSDTYTEYTEVEEQGFFGRLKDAIVGVFVGILLFILGGAALMYNEYDALYRAKDLFLAKKEVISVPIDKVDSANEGKLVHITGEAKTEETLRDAPFGVFQPKTLRLRRKAEMYQWRETEHTKTVERGGKKVKETTYEYRKTWSEDLIDSSSFAKSGYSNPTSMRFQSEGMNASVVTVGAFHLTGGQISDIDGWTNLPPSEAKTIPSGGKIEGDVIYFGTGSEASPSIGDIRISFAVVKPQVISLYAGQRGNSFFPYKTSVAHVEHMRLQIGSATAIEMFTDAENEAAMMKWICRFVGFLLMLIGVALVFKPIQVMADVIPFVGNIVGMGLSVISFAIAAPAALFIIGITWIALRPLFGIIFLAIGIGIFVGIYKLATGRKSSKAAPSSGATPPPVPEG